MVVSATTEEEVAPAGGGGGLIPLKPRPEKQKTSDADPVAPAVEVGVAEPEAAAEVAPSSVDDGDDSEDPSADSDTVNLVTGEPWIMNSANSDCPAATHKNVIVYDLEGTCSLETAERINYCGATKKITTATWIDWRDSNSYKR